MTTKISVNGKGHRLLQYLSEGAATVAEIAREFDLLTPSQVHTYTNRLNTLCRGRLVAWTDRNPGEFEVMKPDWWRYGDVEFRITRLGQTTLAGVEHEQVARPNVRIFARTDAAA